MLGWEAFPHRHVWTHAALMCSPEAPTDTMHGNCFPKIPPWNQKCCISQYVLTVVHRIVQYSIEIHYIPDWSQSQKMCILVQQNMKKRGVLFFKRITQHSTFHMCVHVVLSLNCAIMIN